MHRIHAAIPELPETRQAHAGPIPANHYPVSALEGAVMWNDQRAKIVGKTRTGHYDSVRSNVFPQLRSNTLMKTPLIVCL
ncbi:MAG TPA: hypothetical protein VIK39_06340, partial [Candidatus Angelobacter sp.]